MQNYQIVKWSASLLLITHILLRFLAPEPAIAKDLILYNLIALVAIIALFQAPLHNDPLAVAFLTLAIASWGIGSITSSLSQFFDFSGREQLVSNIAYSLFYPFAFIAITRAIGRGKRLKAIEILYSAIFGLGLSSIIDGVILAHVV